MGINVDYKFKGRDYNELAEAFGISTEDDDKMTADLKGKLLVIAGEYFFAHPQVPAEGTPLFQQMQLCQNFIKTLVAHDASTYDPVFAGLLEIEDGFSFFKMLSAIIEFMWI